MCVSAFTEINHLWQINNVAFCNGRTQLAEFLPCYFCHEIRKPIVSSFLCNLRENNILRCSDYTGISKRIVNNHLTIIVIAPTFIQSRINSWLNHKPILFCRFIKVNLGKRGFKSDMVQC